MKFNKIKFALLLLRGILALTIGSFLAQPAVIYMFDKEIRLQFSPDNEKKKITKHQELNQLFKKRKNELAGQRDVITMGLASKYASVKKAGQNFLSETDDSQGIGKIGIKDVALAKRDKYQKLVQE